MEAATLPFRNIYRLRCGLAKLGIAQSSNLLTDSTGTRRQTVARYRALAAVHAAAGGNRAAAISW